MTIGEKIQVDIVVAMKAKDEHKLTTLRMVKSALKNKEIDKRETLTDAEEQQILTTLIKQRRESVESFTKGGRPELAAKEQAEIGMIEGYLPKAASEDEVRKFVQGAIERCRRMLVERVRGRRIWGPDEGDEAADSGGGLGPTASW